MDLDAVGYVVWGSACLVGAFVLLLLRFTRRRCRRHRCRRGGFLSGFFLWYLSCQVATSALWLTRDSRDKDDDEDGDDSTWLEWAFWQVLLCAGFGYVAIGMAVAAAAFVTDDETQQRVRYVRRGLWFGLMAFALASGVLLSLQLLPGENGSSSGLAIVVFAFYFPAAALAWVVVTNVWWYDWPPTPNVSIMQPTVCMKRFSVVAASMGMIDYLIPALEYLGMPVWESTFLTRLLDSVVYLPGILPWVVWMDDQEPFLASLSFAALMRRHNASSVSDLRQSGNTDEFGTSIA